MPITRLRELEKSIKTSKKSNYELKLDKELSKREASQKSYMKNIGKKGYIK